LPHLVPRYDISHVLIAIPSRNSEEMTRMLQHCRDAQVPCKTVPGIAELIGVNGLTSQIRDVAMEDLLDREPVRLSEEDIRSKILGSTVMVTGAAGSIGSELCRQLARFHPRAIVGFDNSETALFHVQQEMGRSFPEVPFIAEIGNIQNRNRIQHVLDEHQPSVIYHAAAYKHVPMMEANIFEAVENNVLGTNTVALAAAEARVRDFVMISSDKAVNPTNIMGATKRAAERIISGMECRDTKYVSVRFGNVLGSNGSVVPTFKRQIAAGGPVTVTHPEMRRYFMTIPEASQLVIQASTMGHGGEIFVLDMGEQVKIVDLARRLILLSGFRPGHDIQIAFTGMRPGEKLYEELNLDGEASLSTYHPKIKIFRGNPPPLDLAAQLRAMRTLCQSRDARGLLAALCRIAPDYKPGVHLTTSGIRPNRRGVRIAASA
jgi:FlaA1/EpsC-like NDP-sugar epimerase